MIKKKVKGNSTTTYLSENDDVFLDGLKFDDCRSILANCFKSIE